MNRVQTQVRRFWLEPAAPDGLAFLRIAVAALSLLQLSILWPHLPELYGNFGLVQWVITDIGAGDWAPGLGRVGRLLAPLGVSTMATMYAVFVLYAVGLVGLLLGYRTRFFAVLTWFTHGLTSANAYLSLYGVDTILHVLFFYLVFMPSAGRWSLDARAGRVFTGPTSGARVALRTLQFHLCFIYLDTGLSKAQGPQWWNGEALWRALMQPQFRAFDFSWLASYPLLAQLACWGTLLIEVGYAGMIWVPRLRRHWLVATLLLHTGIAVCLRLWLFSLTMMVFNLAAFAWTWRASGAPVKVEDGPREEAPDAALQAV
ncbi:HTTM domain-containing protein [Corallococcus carmarthensis]|uniref:HTTM domain-containing protein n=1 Tax=Corallococcus carmarthensis TaxID=2316728 RepID=UPI00148C8E90|nr:HTTM domain-containing protein [Corallococcus carmarthensis]NOK20132.1 HTTM domain-containing protein [Corallococcus carmarthensis]